MFFVAGELEISFERRQVYGFGVAVEFVADDGVPERLHMYADLMGAAGVNLELHQREEAELFFDLIVCERGLAVAVGDHHAGFCRMFHDGQVDAAFFLRQCALHQSLVYFFYASVFENAAQVFVGRLVFGEDDHAAGLAVEAMDGKDVTIFLPEPGFEGRFFAFPIGNAEHSGGFVDGDEGFVFEDDLGMMVLHGVGYSSSRVLGLAPVGRRVPKDFAGRLVGPGLRPAGAGLRLVAGFAGRLAAGDDFAVRPAVGLGLAGAWFAGIAAEAVFDEAVVDGAAVDVALVDGAAPLGAAQSFARAEEPLIDELRYLRMRISFSVS